MPMFKFFDAVSKTAVIFLISLNLTQKQYQDVQLELLQHHISFHPNQLKSVQENEAKSLALCDSCIKWQNSMVLINMAGMKLKTLG